MKQDIIWQETCKCVCRLTSSVVIVDKYGTKTNVDVNAKKI